LVWNYKIRLQLGTEVNQQKKMEAVLKTIKDVFIEPAQE
jgi:hypothetical protein